MVVRFFRSLMKGASLQDWLSLLRFDDFAKQVYVLDHACMTAFHPFARFQLHSALRSRALPWHVVMLLGKYHRKHIFHGNRLPKVQSAMRQVHDFLARLQWQWLFRGAPREGLLPPLKTKRFSCSAPAASQLVPELHVWCNMFARVAERTLRRARARGGRTRNFGANTVLVEVEALRWIQGSMFLPLPTDKDGGYCLVERSYVKEAQFNILNKPWYAKFPENLADVYRGSCVSYKRLAWSIADSSKCEPLFAQICRSLRGCTHEDLPRKLALTVKTHKPPGDISFRNLHVGGPQPFGGLSVWLNVHLDSVLRKLPHVLQSTHDLASRLKPLEFSYPVALARIDVKDFFMSGTCDDFVACVDLLPVSLQQCAREAIQFLCENQFVVADAAPQELWQVQTGTGMGLIHSSQLCDLAFFRHAEHKLVHSATLAVFGISVYVRFRDDILVVYNAENHQGFRRFMQLLKTKAYYVQLQVEDISVEEAVMLDLHIRVCKHRDSRWILEVGPHFKPTSLQVPLSCSSFHNPSIHVSWPFNQLRRLASLCSHERKFQEVKKAYLKRFQDAQEPFCLVSALHHFNPWPITTNVQRHISGGNTDNKWLVLPYHPVWCRSGLMSELKNFVNSDVARRLWGISFASDPPKVGIAWRNGGPPAKFIFSDTTGISATNFG